MDVQALKLALVEKILKTEKFSLLLKIEKIFQKNENKDWWDDLPVEVQESIKEGIRDKNEGKTYTHEQVLQELKQKYNL